MNIIQPARIPNTDIIVLCYSNETLNATLYALERRSYRWFTGRRPTETSDLKSCPLPIGIRLIPNIRELNYALPMYT